jgi:hypothetical protein
MKLFRLARFDHPGHHGQGLVELAIVLPLLALLLVMAIDFGRIFFGTIALHNAARIGADFAARVADSWGDEDQDLYRELVINDLTAINCQPPAALDADGDGEWDPVDVPDPVYEDANDNGDNTDDGDHAVVDLGCTFALITPLANNLLDGPVEFGAEAYFPINRVIMPALPTPEPPPPGPCPGPTADFTVLENPASGSSDTDGTGDHPLTVEFTDTSTDDPDCAITEWEWDWETDGTPDEMTANATHTFEYPGPGGPAFRTFTVTLTVDNGEDTDTEVIAIRVRRP